MQVRIAIAVEPDQQRWIAYGASDTPEREVVATLRDLIGGRPIVLWLDVQMPEQQPATMPARFVLHNGLEGIQGTSSANGTGLRD